MSLLFSVILLAVEAWTRTESNGAQCCYLYGSTPRNGSNCVPEGTQVNLFHYILNPHDNLTNLTVKWFKADDVPTYESTPDSEALSSTQNNYKFYSIIYQQNTGRSCDIGPLYRDSYFMIINNFTSYDNGYYWCQIFVNSSGSLSSQYAWFYATDKSSCMQRSYFMVANPPHCALFHPNSVPTSMMNLQITKPEAPHKTAMHIAKITPTKSSPLATIYKPSLQHSTTTTDSIYTQRSSSTTLFESPPGTTTTGGLSPHTTLFESPPGTTTTGALGSRTTLFESPPGTTTTRALSSRTTLLESPPGTTTTGALSSPTTLFKSPPDTTTARSLSSSTTLLESSPGTTTAKSSTTLFESPAGTTTTRALTYYYAATTAMAPKSGMEQLAYVAGFLCLFILILTSLVILLLLRYVWKVQKEKHLKSGKPKVIKRKANADDYPRMETLAWANSVLHDTDIPTEEGIYSVVDDISIDNQLKDHNTELLNQCDSQAHSQYNTRHWERNVSILADNDLCPNTYETIAETQLRNIDLHQAKYDAVANPGTGLEQVVIETQTSNKQNQIVPQSYETVYQVTNIKRKVESTDYGVNDSFDDERHSKPQPTLQSVENSFDYCTPQSVPRMAAAHDDSESSAYQLKSEAAEYTEPYVSKRTKHDETEAQTVECSNEHYYHNLEQEKVGVPKATVNTTLITEHDNRVQHECDSQNLAALPVRINDERYTQAHTAFSYITEAMNGLGNMNSPILLHNTEDCEFDDPRYDSVPRKSLVALHPTQTKTSPLIELTSEHDEIVSSTMDVNPELLASYEDAPDYGDPIDFTSVHNEPYREVNGSEGELIFDDPTYA